MSSQFVGALVVLLAIVSAAVVHRAQRGTSDRPTSTPSRGRASTSTPNPRSKHRAVSNSRAIEPSPTTAHRTIATPVPEVDPFRKKRSATQQQRTATFARWGFRCVYCGVPGDEEPLDIDHIIPFSQGGTSIRNFQPLCKNCNSVKRARSDLDARHRFAAQHGRPTLKDQLIGSGQASEDEGVRRPARSASGASRQRALSSR
jgi:5-methylcytosine-specific restriction endonuclease McrA